MKRVNKTPVFMGLLLLGGVVLLISSAFKTDSRTGSSSNPSGDWFAPASSDTIKNPFKGDAASVAEGKKIYQKNCVVCHGDKGKGDGVASAGLTPKPADHSSDKCQKQSDGVLFWKITNGRSPMPAYASILKKNERWALVNYIRTLSKSKK
jgi:mono/diheme cytochrome c family protein